MVALWIAIDSSGPTSWPILRPAALKRSTIAGHHWFVDRPGRNKVEITARSAPFVSHEEPDMIAARHAR